MADKTSIEWSDATWNIITGCTRVSRGCGGPGGGGCYAERLAATRLRNHPSRAGLTNEHGIWNGQVRFNAEWLAQPLRYSRPRKIFACAHSDLFHESVPDEWIDRVFAVMALSGRHVFQLLTKRPERMRGYLCEDISASRIHEVIYGWLLHDKPGPAGYRFSRQERWDCARRADRWQPQFSWPLPNVWLGVSAEDQATADERIPILLAAPAAVRWLSAEPLLGPMQIDEYLAGPAGLDWVVAGGESGSRARPMEAAWARSLRNQCLCTEVSFFFKQWGGRTSKAGGAVLDGREWRQFPDAA